jgi:hypothetical protein
MSPHLHGQAVFFITLLQLLAPNNENTTVFQTLGTICPVTSHPEDLSVREGQVSEVLDLTQF